MKKFIISMCGLFFLSTFASITNAAQVYTNRTTFSEALSESVQTVDFDSLPIGTNLDGVSMGNILLDALNTNTLEVMNVASFYEYSTSSGSNILSPGGSNYTDENDDIRIDFLQPVSSVGLDILFQVPDSYSYTNIYFYSASGDLIGSTGNTATSFPSPTGYPGYQFAGLIVSETDPLISYMIIEEFDSTSPDHNIAIDSVTFSAVPIPETFCLLYFGIAGIIGVRRQKR